MTAREKVLVRRTVLRVLRSGPELIVALHRDLAQVRCKISDAGVFALVLPRVGQPRIHLVESERLTVRAGIEAPSFWLW